MYITRNILFIFSFLLLSTTLWSQDTLRITIPDIDISLEDEGEIVAVPVFIDYPSNVALFQLGMTWDAEELELDTLIFGNLLTSVFSSYNQTSESQLRAITNINSFPFQFSSSTPAFTAYFRLKKFTGLVNIEFDPSFRMLFGQDNQIVIPHTTTNGTITYNDQQARTLFSTPTPLSDDGTICTGLFSRGMAPLLGFDFNVDWDTTAFRLVDVGYADNPLGLRDEELAWNPTSLRLARDTALRDTTPRLPYGLQLLELCFEPTTLNSTSFLRIGRSEDPVFHLVFEDSLYSPAPYNLFPGSLYLRGEQARDTVKLTIGAPISTDIPDSLLCTTVRAQNYVDVSTFDFSASWPEGLTLSQISYPDGAPELAGTALLAQSTTSARFGLNPDEPVNLTLSPGTPIVELCFSGDFTPCGFYPIELAEQPAETGFERRVLDLPGGFPLSYALTSGYVHQEGGDALRLTLEHVVSHPDSSLHRVRLSTTSDVCVDDVPFLVSYDFSELGLDEVALAPERTDDFRIRRRGSPVAGAKGFTLERVAGAEINHLTPGEIATFTFTRRGAQDTVPVGLLHFDTDTIAVVREDGFTLGIPVVLTDGGIVFGIDTTTSTTYFNVPQNPPLTVYPNPSSGNINLKGLRASERAMVWVYDRGGRLLRHLPNSGDRVNLSGLPAGVFWLRVEQGEFRWMEKVVLVK